MADLNPTLIGRQVLFSFLFLFFFSQEIQATHNAGLEMFYRHKTTTLSDSTYEFTLVYYRNCQGFTAGAPLSVLLKASSASIGSLGSIACSRLPTSGVGVPSLEPSDMYNCTKSYNLLCYEEYVYRGSWTSPRRANDWKFSYQLCCRPNTNAPTNVQYGIQYIECGLNNLDFPDHKAKNWSPFWHNRRPNHPGYETDTVINYLFKTLCSYQYYSLDMGVREYQGDSVTYNFYWPQTSNGNKAAYINTWSFNNPLPTLNGTLTINHQTGVIPVIPGPPTGTGIYVLGIEAKEWRYDTIVSGGNTVRVAKQIGYVRRDMTIWIDDTSNCRRDSVHVKDIYLDTINVDKLLKVHFNSGGLGHPNSLVRCETLSPDGSEFRVIDSSNYVAPYDSTIKFIGVVSASWTCHAGLTDEVTLKLTEPIKCGDYHIILRTGTDLDVLQSECGFWEPDSSSAKIHTVNTLPQVDIGPDTAMCKYTPWVYELDAGPGYASYFWNTWATTRKITVNYARMYSVEVTNNFGCISSDTMYIVKKACDTTNNDTSNTNVREISIREVKIFPNPSYGIVNIALDYPENIEEIMLFNNIGARLTSQSIEKSPSGYLLRLEGLDQGIYYLNILDKKGNSIVRKVIYSKP